MFNRYGLSPFRLQVLRVFFEPRAHAGHARCCCTSGRCRFLLGCAACKHLPLTVLPHCALLARGLPGLSGFVPGLAAACHLRDRQLLVRVGSPALCLELLHRRGWPQHPRSWEECRLAPERTVNYWQATKYCSATRIRRRYGT